MRHSLYQVFKSLEDEVKMLVLLDYKYSLFVGGFVLFMVGRLIMT